MRTEKEQMESPILYSPSNKKYLSGEEHNFMVNWSDQKDFGTKRGFLGMKKGTIGRFLGFDDFIKKSSEIQSK
jgi:hypothetical protein